MNGYPLLIDSYIKFCNYRSELNKKGVLDLTDVKWFYPATLLPTFDIMGRKESDHKYILPKNEIARGYFEFMTDNKTGSETGTSIPILKANRLDDTYIDRIYSLIMKEEKNENIRTAIKYVIGEIVANIDEHSKCHNSIFMAQSYKTKGFCEVAFFDNGVTIPGSFREAKLLEKGTSDADCIKNAIEGRSTKPEGGRGHGLPSTTKILKAMNSDILIVSGNGAAY